MADKAKHAHGSRANLDVAIANKVVDAFDVLFLSGEDEAPAFGWLDKNGNPILITPTDDLAEVEAKLEAEIATKIGAEEVEAAIATKADAADVESLESQLATKANSSDVAELETEVATKVDAATVKAMIDEATVGAIEVVEF